MLYQKGVAGGIPSPFNYVAKSNNTIVMAIHSSDFLKVIPQKQIDKLIIDLDVNS